MNEATKRQEQGLFVGAMETALAAAMTDSDDAKRLAQAVAAAVTEAASGLGGRCPAWANLIPAVVDTVAQQYANTGCVDGRLVELLMDCGRAADSRGGCDL